MVKCLEYIQKWNNSDWLIFHKKNPTNLTIADMFLLRGYHK